MPDYVVAGFSPRSGRHNVEWQEARTGAKARDYMTDRDTGQNHECRLGRLHIGHPVTEESGRSTVPGRFVTNPPERA
jgi:hypothetical protein